jgi:hypothetical protein
MSKESAIRFVTIFLMNTCHIARFMHLIGCRFEDVLCYNDPTPVMGLLAIMDDNLFSP